MYTLIFLHAHLQITAVVLLRARGQVQVCFTHLTVGPGQMVAAIEGVFFSQM